MADLLMILLIAEEESLVARAKTLSERETRRDQALRNWAKRTGVELKRLDAGQQWVVFAALQAMTLLGEGSVLKRVVIFLLAHSGMDLRPTVIAAVVGTSDRTIRNVRAYSPAELLASVRLRMGGNHKPKLEAVHAGVVAKLLVQHPDVRVKKLLQLIADEIGVTVDRLTLRRFLKQYGLGCLRGDLITDRAPFLPKPSLAEVSS